MLAWLNALQMIYHLSLIDLSSCADAYNHNNTLQYTSLQFHLYQLIPVSGQPYWKKVLANIHRLVPCIWILGGISDLGGKMKKGWIEPSRPQTPDRASSPRLDTCRAPSANIALNPDLPVLGLAAVQTLYYTLVTVAREAKRKAMSIVNGRNALQGGFLLTEYLLRKCQIGDEIERRRRRTSAEEIGNTQASPPEYCTRQG